MAVAFSPWNALLLWSLVAAGATAELAIGDEAMANDLVAKFGKTLKENNAELLSSFAKEVDDKIDVLHAKLRAEIAIGPEYSSKVPPPPFALYDCFTLYDNWEAAWSPDWKQWCCQYQGRGCVPTSTTTATQSVLPTQLEVLQVDCASEMCKVKNRSASCADRIIWASQHETMDAENPLQKAHDVVAAQCGECGACALEDVAALAQRQKAAEAAAGQMQEADMLKVKQLSERESTAGVTQLRHTESAADRRLPAVAAVAVAMSGAVLGGFALKRSFLWRALLEEEADFLPLQPVAEGAPEV